jgi:hypothetical protein
MPEQLFPANQERPFHSSKLTSVRFRQLVSGVQQGPQKTKNGDRLYEGAFGLLVAWRNPRW